MSLRHSESPGGAGALAAVRSLCPLFSVLWATQHYRRRNGLGGGRTATKPRSKASSLGPSPDCCSGAHPPRPSLAPTYAGVPGPHVGGPAPAATRGDPAHEPSLPPVPVACAPGCPGERRRVSRASRRLRPGGGQSHRPGRAERGPESAIRKVCLWVKHHPPPEASSRRYLCGLGPQFSSSVKCPGEGCSAGIREPVPGGSIQAGTVRPSTWEGGGLWHWAASLCPWRMCADPTIGARWPGSGHLVA